MAGTPSPFKRNVSLFFVCLHEAELDNTLQFSALSPLFLSLLCEDEAQRVKKDLKHVKQAPAALLKGQVPFQMVQLSRG